MSHFSQIKTCIRDRHVLGKALTSLGIEWKLGPSEVRGYQSKAHLADVIIEQSNNYDIGFSWNGSEYALITDLQFWQQNLSVEGFINKITQQYAYQIIVDTTANKGFMITEQNRQENGVITMVLQRWS